MGQVDLGYASAAQGLTTGIAVVQEGLYLKCFKPESPLTYARQPPGLRTVIRL